MLGLYYIISFISYRHGVPSSCELEGMLSRPVKNDYRLELHHFFRCTEKIFDSRTLSQESRIKI